MSRLCLCINRRLASVSLVACRAVIAFLLVDDPAACSAAGSQHLTRSAFARPSVAAGGTLFTKLDPATTGIAVQNPYDDPQMWQSRYREFMGGGLGSGVAVGDFDADGKADLYVSTKTKPGRLYKNTGNWKFSDVTDAAGLAEEGSVLSWLKDAVSTEKPVVWRQGAVFADVDNDGHLDLYVSRNNAPNLLYINQGDGTFEEEAERRGLAVVDGSVVGAFADYDRDGWLDVFIVTNQVDGTEHSGRPDRLFRNSGNGHFTEVTQRAGISGGTFGHSATWIDYDHDGWLDLYVANDFSGADRFYRNNGDGSFTDVLDAVVPHTPFSSMGSDLADINNDGHFDLLVADMATTSREKDRRGLAASRDDVVLLAAKDATAPQYMRNALLLNTGTGLFAEAACWAGIDATDWTWSVRFEDFDNDGWADLHVTNGMVREPNNVDLLAQMMRALSDTQRIGVMKKSPLLAESNLAYRNKGGTGFEPVMQPWGLDEVGVSFGAGTGDFDNDGDLDLAYLSYDGGVSVFRNDVLSHHRVQIRLRGTRSNRHGVGAVVRIESASAGLQSQTLTVARGYAAGSEMVAHFGLGPDEKISRLIVEWPSGVTQTFREVDADFAYLVTESGSPATPPKAEPPGTWFRAQSDALGLKFKDASAPVIPEKEQVFIPFRTDRRGPGLAIADIDGDEHDDIYIGATTGSAARLLRWRDGKFADETPGGIATGKIEDGPSLLLDVDGNGTRDLLVTKASANATLWPEAYRPVIYSNDGRGRFTPTERLPELRMNVGAVASADFDGDGDLDLFLGGRSVPGRYPEIPSSVLLRNDNGRFVDVTTSSPRFEKLGLVKSAVSRDIDRDGRADLVIALEWDFVRYFHNDGEATFSDWTEKAGFGSGGRGWWNSIASGDLNGDGRPDFAAGNLGLNTTYKASPKHPATLLYGDFARNGTRLIMEAVYDGDALFPWRSRKDLGARIPAVLRKFPRNDDFARANLKDIFGPEPLGSADVYAADNFSSGVFLSQPDGTYRFEPFPRFAQLAPMHGIVAADLDGDSRIDLCAVQNTDIAVPAFHGGAGVLLKGNGDGSFTALRPTQSGIVVPGNGRALAIIDPNGDARPDLFLTRHGGFSEFLAHQTAAPRWLKLQLKAGGRNPDAIGAQVEIVYSNNTKSHHELGYESAWLTQAAPRVFIAIPSGERVTEAVVRWPDGHRSRHADAPEHGAWLIRQPAE